MMRHAAVVLAFVAGFVLGGLVFAPAPQASPGQGISLGPRVPAPLAPACEHRGGQHIDRHGGKLEDDRFHIARGERPTCDGDKDREDKEPAEKHPEEPHEVHLPSRHGDDTDDHHGDGHTCIGRCNRDHSWWH